MCVLQNIFVAFVLLISCCAGGLHGANILCLVGTSQYNNPGWTQPLFSALASRGHTLTVLSTAAVQQQAGITHVPLPNKYDVVHKHYVDPHTGDFQSYWSIKHLMIWYESMLGSCRVLMDLNADETNEQLKQQLNQKYDLIIYDATYALDCLLSLMTMRRRVPVLGLSGGKLSTDLLAIMRAEDTINAASVPHFISDLPQQMNYWQRLQNHAMFLGEIFIHYSVVHQVLTGLLGNRYHYPRVSLMLLNTHPVLDYVQNMPPNIVEVGGLHIRAEAEPLPSVIELFIEDHPDGIIYISLPHIELMHGLGGQAIADMMEQHSKYGFIWNVKNVKKLLPKEKLPNLLTINVDKNLQQDILAQYQIKAFITHGDSFSLQEAVYNGVPVVVLPLILEQLNNAKRVEERHLGYTIPANNFTRTSISEALKEVLYSEIYADAVLYAKIAFRTRIMPPLEQAVAHAEQLIAEPQLYDHLSRPEVQSLSYFVGKSLDVLALPALFLLLFVFNLAYLIMQFFDGYKAMKQNKYAVGNGKDEIKKQKRDKIKTVKTKKEN